MEILRPLYETLIFFHDSHFIPLFVLCAFYFNQKQLDRHPITGKPISHFELSSELLELVTGTVTHISRLHGGRLNIPPPQYFTGRIVNVAIWEPSHWDVVTGANMNLNTKCKLQVGDFVRLRNVKDGMYDCTKRGKFLSFINLLQAIYLG